ncbi:MAG: hypothetical protein LBJ63_06270 [Prevotellaceae bacterium]|jgi:hypothetical protein|nr:hypothetical protein [Prevotellaceae bacterium]
MKSKIMFTIANILFITSILLNLASLILLTNYNDVSDIMYFVEACMLLAGALIYFFVPFKRKPMKVKDQYGETVTVFEIKGNMAMTDKGRYHTSNLFVNGESLQTILNKRS